MRGVVFFVLVVAAACTTTREVHVPVYSTPEAPDAAKPARVGDDDDDEVIPKLDAGNEDSAKETGPSGLTPTRKTTAVMTIENVKRTLERAQFGLDADGTFHIEAHEGGDPACPDQDSPSPKRTLIIAGVKSAAAGTKQTKAEGVVSSFLDFANDQLPPDVPFTKATAITIEIVAIKGTTEVELEIDATFAEGTAKGRVFAEFCQSLSE